MPTETYTTPGEYTLTVPDGVTEVTVRCWGAGGANASSSGGTGGYAEAAVPVTGGNDLIVRVGGAGSVISGGFNGGGDGSSSGDTSSGGGGGASDVRTSSNLSDRLIVAGGGGGSGSSDDSGNVTGAGGDGGGLQGVTGGSGDGTTGGGGGDQSSGGAGGTSTGGYPSGYGGQFGAGGDAADADSDLNQSNMGGGGGGGWYGGGGGTYYFDQSSGGGGGSGFAVSSATNVTHTAGGGNTGDGRVEIEYPLSPPGGVTVDEERETEVDVSWNSVAGTEEYRVYRHDEPGAYSNGSQIATTTSTSFTDTGLANGRQYHYQVTAATQETESDPSSEVVTTTLLPTTDIDSTTPADTSIGLSWTKADNNPDGSWELYVSQTEGTLGSIAGTITDASATQGSADGLLNGTDYWLTLRRDTGDATADSVQVAATTLLPDVSSFVLDASTVNELLVMQIEPVLNAGRYRIQWKEADASSYPSGNDATLVHDASPLTYDITGVLAGEKYDVRVRSETDDVTGTWLTASKVTKLVPADGLQATNVTETSVDLSWTDNAAFDGSYQIWRDRADYDYQDPKGTHVATLASTATSFSDSGLAPEREYSYTARAVTQWVFANSDPLDATTVSVGARQTALPSSGWLVEADHPSGRTVRPTLLDDTNRSPSIRDLYRATAHVPMDDRWQDGSFEQVPARAWADGDRLPVEQLDAVGRTESSSDARTTLELVGGTGLRTRVERDVDTQPAHGLVEELVKEHTDLAVNVDAPESTTSQEVLLDLSTASEFASHLSDVDLSTIPLEVDQDNDVLRTQQSCWPTEAEDVDRSISATVSSNPSFSQGSGVEFDNEAGEHSVEFDFAVGYDIPEGDFGIRARMESDTDTTVHEYAVSIDIGKTGSFQQVEQATRLNGMSLGWFDAANDTDISGGVPAGTHRVRFERTAVNDTDFEIDMVAPYDQRYDYNFDNSVDSNDALDGPERYPAVEVTFDRLRSVLSVAGVEVEAGMDDVSDGQALAARNFAAGEWRTAQNTGTLDVDFDELGALVDVRVTIGRHGSQTSTPTTGIEPQELQSLTVTADLDTTPLVIQRSPDDTILALAKQFAKDANAVFGIGIDDGELSFEWTQLGQRDGGEVVDVELLDESTDYDHPERVIVYGGLQDVREETATVEHDTAVDLVNERLDPNSEYVRDEDGTDYAEGDDYEIDWSGGSITALPDGEISDGATLTIDYAFQPRASQELDGVGDDPREIVERIPELESERGCGLAAFRILEEVGEPLQSATVQLPEDLGVSVVEAVSAEGLTADSYELQSIDGQAAGTQFDLGNRRQANDVVDDIRSQLRSLSGQV